LIKEHDGGDKVTFKEELEEILKEELKVLKELQIITQEKTQIIIDEDLDKLQNTTKEEEEYINNIALLELKREELLDNWGMDRLLPLSVLISKMPEGERESLESIGEDLFHILSDIDEKNQLNNTLIRDNLEWIDFNLNLLTSTQVPTTYGKDKSDLNQSKSIFDRKV